MKFSTAVLLPIALAGFCAAMPSYERRTTTPSPANSTNVTTIATDEPSESAASLNQTQVLQFALTLEHLENAFYTKYLNQFTADQFANESYPDYVYGGLMQISEHEQSHVNFLTEALGPDAVDACNYSFPVTDIASFVALSRALESVGTSAYIGAAHFLSDPEVITAAGSILATEARHSGFVASDILNEAPWSSSFNTPLDPNQVFTLASQFITNCPASNPTLPLQAFPALANISGATAPGSEVTFEFNASTNGTTYFALFNGLNTTFTPFTVSSTANGTTSGTAIIPDFIQGLIYGLITSDNASVSDAVTVAGPVILDYAFDSNVSNFRV